MSQESDQILMMGYIDGELSPEQELEFREKLKQKPDLAAELAEYQNLDRIATGARLAEPTDFQWERFWSGYYNRMERRSGWLFLVIGITLLASYGIIEFLRSPGIHVLMKVGAGATALGLIILFLSVLRGRLNTVRYDPYRGVKR